MKGKVGSRDQRLSGADRAKGRRGAEELNSFIFRVTQRHG